MNALEFVSLMLGNLRNFIYWPFLSSNGGNILWQKISWQALTPCASMGSKSVLPFSTWKSLVCMFCARISWSSFMSSSSKGLRQWADQLSPLIPDVPELPSLVNASSSSFYFIDWYVLIYVLVTFLGWTPSARISLKCAPKSPQKRIVGLKFIYFSYNPFYLDYRK